MRSHVLACGRRRAGATCLAIVLTSLSVPGLARDLFDDMSAGEREATGVDKLTRAEREMLVEWLQNRAQPKRAQPDTRTPAPVDANAAPVSREKRGMLDWPTERERRDQEIETHIVGEFTGWSGRTVFRLANGQVWQQRQSGTYRSRTRNDPPVVIYRSFGGRYTLRLSNTGRRIGVVRIK